MARHVTDEERERARRGGRWLREQRLQHGYETGVDFAEALGIKQARLSSYENGNYLVEVGVARRIAQVFGMTEWQVWRGLQLPLPRELDDDEAIRMAFKDFPEVMAKVPEIYERVTGRKLQEPPPVTGESVDRPPGDTRLGDRRRNADPGRESAV